MTRSLKTTLLGVVGGLLGVGLLVGSFGLGFFFARSVARTDREFRSGWTRDEVDVEKAIEDTIDTGRLREVHRNLSSRSSLSGTAGDLRLAQELRDMWLAAGVDEVRVLSYDVYVSFPNRTDPTRMVAFDENRSVLYNDTFEERQYDPSERTFLDEVEPPYIAYGKSGTVEGELYYGNVCDNEAKLELRSRGVNLTGAILMCRESKQAICDRNVRRFFVEEGIVAAICFTDPRNVAPNGTDNVYPKSPYLPGDAAMRFPSASQFGDAMTPEYPSVSYVPRRFTEQEMERRRNIGIIKYFIGYDYALKLISHTNLSSINPSWWEPIETTVSYNIKPKQRKIAKFFRFSVTTISQVKPIYNVFAFINGWEEPHRYIVFGNHKDSFHYGAIDSKSSTTIMCESVKVFGSLLQKKAWRPRRTLVFAAWSGEELGLLGSYEFVEEFWRILQDRTIVYVNSDVAVLGNGRFQASATPLFEDLLHEVAKSVSNPLKADDGEVTLYDSWFSRDPDNTTYDDRTVPNLHKGLGGTDYYSFVPRGIPFIEMLYSNLDSAEFESYHTGYDTHLYTIKFVDEKFMLHRAMASMYAKVVFRLSNDPILPISVNPLAVALQRAFEGLNAAVEARNLTDIKPHSTLLPHLRAAVQDFGNVAATFSRKLEKLKQNRSATFTDRLVVNEKLMRIDRNLATVMVYGLDVGNKLSKYGTILSWTADRRTIEDAYTETIWNIRSAIANLHDLHFESLVHTEQV